MTKLAKLAGTLPFAHLLGVKAAKSESEEDDEKDKKKDDESEDDPNSKKAESEDERPKDDEKKGDDAKGKKAKSEEEDEEGESAKAAAQAERARCAAIVAHGINSGSVRQACAYAFDTGMSAEVAIATLDATAEDRKAAKPGLASRMAAEETAVVRPAAEAPAAGSIEATVAMCSAALAKARGDKA